MFHAHVSEFAELGWMGFFEVDGLMEAATATAHAARRRLARRARCRSSCWRVAIGLFVALDAPGLDRIGVPQEELAVERTVLHPGEIELHVRNDGADPVQIEQAIVNDGFASFTPDRRRDRPARRRPRSTCDYPWIEGQAYEVMLLTATGGDDRPRDRGGRRDARRRPRLLRPDGADRPLRRA